MLEFGDTFYYIDLKAFDKAIAITHNKDETNTDIEEKITLNEKGEPILTEKFLKTTPKIKEIDAIKYDLLKNFLDYIIDYEEISDDTYGADGALDKTSFSFKLAFNTLYNENIIKEKN